MEKKISIKVAHVENSNITVTATGKIINGEFVGEYKYKGMTYGITFPVSGCDVGDHDIIPILGFENEIVGEECRQCGKQFK